MCVAILGVLNQEEVYYHLYMDRQVCRQIAIARHATGLHANGCTPTIILRCQEQWLHSMKGGERGNAYD